MDTNTRNWIADRVENGEALMWPAFIQFMRNIEASEKKLATYRSKKYRRQVKVRYKKERAEEKVMKRYMPD